MAVGIPLTALMVVLSEPVCYALADASIAQNTTDPTEHEYLVETALAVRDFSLGNDAAVLPTGDDYKTTLTPDALSHLLDVRVVFLVTELAWVVVCITLLVLIVIAARSEGRRYLVCPLLIGGVVPLGIAGLLAMAVAIDFSAFFTWMHSLFFTEGTWTFPADSLLIRSLPFNFWVGCAVVWGAIMALLCSASILIGVLCAQRTQRAS